MENKLVECEIRNLGDPYHIETNPLICKNGKVGLILMLLESSSFRICQAVSCWKGEDIFGI